jgi:hypothetical protein
MFILLFTSKIHTINVFELFCCDYNAILYCLSKTPEQRLSLCRDFTNPTLGISPPPVPPDRKQTRKTHKNTVWTIPKGLMRGKFEGNSLREWKETVADYCTGSPCQA